jgi:predicted RNA-binding Zn-ribbon protein involved in translation (DUF1610 family)
MAYILQKADNTLCPNCGKTVQLLCKESLFSTGSMFYICWFCEKIFQVGIGEVKKAEE